MNSKQINDLLILSVKSFIIDNADETCSRKRISYFFHWLRKRNLLHIFLANFNCKYKNQIHKPICLSLVINYSFIWNKSKEGHVFWAIKSLDWQKHVNNNKAWIALLT